MAKRSFPADGVLLDNNVLVRLYKCEALERLQGFTSLHATAHVCAEFEKLPGQRQALRKLQIKTHPIKLGTPEWDVFCRIRGGRFNTKDLGEHESLALCASFAEHKGKLLPFVTFDKGPARIATTLQVPTLDFLSLLSWLVACGSLSYEEADDLERRAAQCNGWKRPEGYPGQLEPRAEALRQTTAQAVHQWRLRLRGAKRPGRSR